MSGAWYFKSLCERVCTVASNINGHVVAGEASLSQFLLGEEDRGESSFHCDNYRVAGDKNSLKVSCAVNPILCSHTGWKS